VRSEVTKLGLQFHLVTQFTSFVAVDRSRVVGEAARVVVQPSMLPEGVNPATTTTTSESHDDGGGWGGGGGGSWGLGDSSPQPWWLLIMFVLGGIWLFVRRSIS
jgi:hypothetical protein